MKKAALLLASISCFYAYSLNVNISDNTSASLVSAINTINASGDPTGNTITYTITGQTVLLSSDLPVLTKGTIVIGNSNTIDGQSTQRLFTGFAPLQINNLSLQNGLAVGGNGGQGLRGGSGTYGGSGGGGAGMGGAIYIDKDNALVLSNVSISSCKAQGGAGGDGYVNAIVTNAIGVSGGGGGASFFNGTIQSGTAKSAVSPTVNSSTVNFSGSMGGGDRPGGYPNAVATNNINVANPAGLSISTGTFTGYGGGVGGTFSPRNGGSGGGSGAGTSVTTATSNGGNGGYCAGGGGGSWVAAPNFST